MATATDDNAEIRNLAQDCSRNQLVGTLGMGLKSECVHEQVAKRMRMSALKTKVLTMFNIGNT